MKNKDTTKMVAQIGICILAMLLISTKINQQPMAQALKQARQRNDSLRLRIEAQQRNIRKLRSIDMRHYAYFGKLYPTLSAKQRKIKY